MALTVDQVLTALDRLRPPRNPTQRNALRVVVRAARLWVASERPQPTPAVNDWVTLLGDRVGIVKRELGEWLAVVTDGDGDGTAWTVIFLDRDDIVEVLGSPPPQAGNLPPIYQ